MEVDKNALSKLPVTRRMQLQVEVASRLLSIDLDRVYLSSQINVQGLKAIYLLGMPTPSTSLNTLVQNIVPESRRNQKLKEELIETCQDVLSRLVHSHRLKNLL